MKLRVLCSHARLKPVAELAADWRVSADREQLSNTEAKHSHVGPGAAAVCINKGTWEITGQGGVMNSLYEG